MTPGAVTPIGTVCDLAGLAVKLQAQHEAIHCAKRHCTSAAAWINRNEVASIDHADRQTAYARHAVMRAMTMFPAANN